MLNKFVAYDIEEVRKKNSLSEIKTWYKGGILTEIQWNTIKEEYTSHLYTPSIIMRVFLFCITVIGIATILGPIFLLLEIEGESSIRVILFLLGIASIAFTEFKMIKTNQHFKSGVTEAGYYIGYLFVYFGLLWFDVRADIVYSIVAMVFLLIASIRYLDLVSLIGAVVCFIIVLLLGFESYIVFMPFMVMAVFTGLFLLSKWIYKKVDQAIWENHFIVFEALSLLLIYLGGNYFVVREMSVELMRISLNDGEDIPFAFLFYGFTFLIPVFYFAWGVAKRSILFIRVGLLTIALSVITIKYYYSLGYPEVTVTIAGAVMILISLGLMYYLKQSRNGYTRDKILQTKWDDTNLTAFIASQTLGGTQITKTEKGFTGKGGEFGGGGASGSF